MKHRLNHLDFLRGVAAIMVAAGHLRTFMFVEYQQSSIHNPFVQLFYFATGLGHQSVILFFVLSGYLVGGSVLDTYRSKRFSWLDYALRRMTRLWIVLIPALILTFVWDTAGCSINSKAYYGHDDAIYNSGPRKDSPIDLRVTTFLGNVAFLQTITVPCYGTNGPLWSLANEFWYYLLFPLLLGIYYNRTLFWRIVNAAVFCFIICWLPSGLVLSGLIWFAGAVASVVSKNESCRRFFGHPIVLITSALLSLGVLLSSKYIAVFGSDWIVGIAFVFLIITVTSTERQIKFLRTISTYISEFSYTLYVMHFPLLAFIFFGFSEGIKYMPTFMNLLSYLAILLLCIGYSVLLWWVFERNTDRVRKWISNSIRKKVT